MAEVSKNTRRSQAPKRSYPKRNISNDHSLRKRTPQKQVNQENAVYVTKKTNIKALIQKCEKLFEKNFNEIVIHCMGAAIQQGINLALQLCEKYPNYQLSVNTSTITLTDDLEPLTDEGDYETQRRQNSALHIKVIRTNLVEESTKK